MEKLMENLKKFGSLDYLKRLLSPPAGHIGGLEISDAHIRFFDARKKIWTSALRMPPGIIQGGKIMDGVKFREALVELRKGFAAKPKEKINVIISLPAEVVYLQVFNLPYLTGENLESAVNLNLQMISPMPFEDAYVSWEVLGETEDGQLEILSAFSEKKNIELLVSGCRESNFMVVAIEPAILSLVRSVKEITGIDMKDPHVILNSSDMGMDFAGIKNNKVYFDYFVSWRSIYGDAKEISRTRFEETIVQYVRKVLTFSASHSRSEMKRLLLVTQALEESFRDVIRSNFNLQVMPIAFTKYGKMNPEWGIALGAYERGRIPRSKDALISLTSIGTKEEFEDSQIISFIVLWRNVALTFSAFIFLAFLSVNIFIGNISEKLKTQPAQAFSEAQVKELTGLKAEAKEFNSYVALIAAAKYGQSALIPYFSKLITLGQGLKFTRIYFQSFTAPVIINGEAESEQAVLNFKNIVAQQSEFKDIQLPLTGLITSGVKTTFSMTLSFSR